MGKDLYEASADAKQLFETANEILRFSITDIMFGEDAEALKQTKVTQPAVFLHSVILAKVLGDSFKPEMVAGHSLGEFSALVSAGYLSFEDGLKLVSKRAMAMQKACEQNPSTMAAVLGLENEVVENICKEIKEIVVPANYNCPGQLVISGSNGGIDIACEKLTEAGARRAIKLPVGGAFHSPLMEPARAELEQAIDETNFAKGVCAIYQNVTATAITNPEEIKENLKKQLTASVLWTQTMQQMIADGLSSVTEVGPGKVLQGLFKKVDRKLETQSASL
jgi:[acyl-carrier-protein] S-malonyltransferase